MIHDDENNRVGAVCFLEKLIPDESKEDDDGLEPMMQEAAATIERQMEEQQALIARTASLQSQIKSLEQEDPNVAKLFLNVMKPPQAALPPITRNSSELAMFKEGRATADQMAHLPPDFFALHDQLQLPRPPIAPDDMQSIATVEEMNLNAIHPDSTTGKRLIQFITMAAKLTGCPCGVRR